jgi:uncharacterized protein
MYTLFDGTYSRYGAPDGVAYTPNEYLIHYLDAQNILLTTRHRAWVILEPSEYECLLQHRLHEQPMLFSLLEDLGIILTARNARDVAVTHCQRYAFLHLPPTLFIMVPTLRCNMSCVYCHAQAKSASAGKYDMSEEVLYKAVDFFFSVPRGQRQEISIEFQGGEPLLRYDLVQKAMDYANQKAGAEGLKTHYVIVSNLTLMNDAIARDVKERGNVRICSSLDGPASVHDRQRVYPNGRGTFADVIRGAARLQERTGQPTPFLPTFTVNSLGYETEIVDEYIAQDCRSIFLRRVNRTGRAFESGYDDIGITAEQFVEVWKTTLEHVIEKNRQGIPVLEAKTTYLLGNMLNAGHSFMCLRRPCGCGVSQVVVEHDGTLYGCDGGRSVEMLALGNVLTDTYDQVYTSETARALRTLASETLPLCQSCAFGPYCGYCVARGINQHGSPVPHTLQDSECRVFKAMLPFLFRKLLDRWTAILFTGWHRSFFYRETEPQTVEQSEMAAKRQK